MPDSHAVLSPSASARWMTCPGSVILSEGMERKTSAYAGEGTKAHALAEAVLLNHILPAHDEDMLSAVLVYTDYVRELSESQKGAVLHVEKRVQVSKSIYGTADAIVWLPEDKTLWVVDYKHGAGVPVEVSDNSQLKIYALAALLTMGYLAEHVNVGIAQPRIPHPDGPVRVKEYDVVDLLDFYADVQEAEGKVSLASIATSQGRTESWEDMYLVPGEKACRWCPASPKCPKIQKHANALAKKVFAPDTPYDPNDLAKVLGSLSLMESWIANVRRFAYAEAAQGRSIPGYKLVNKKADRKWKTDTNVFDIAVSIGCDPNDLLEPVTLLGVKVIEKKCPGSNEKERATFLEPFVERVSSGHVLVVESDKRKAVSLDAGSAFAELD